MDSLSDSLPAPRGVGADDRGSVGDEGERAGTGELIGAAGGGQRLGQAGQVPGADDPGPARLFDEHYGGERGAAGRVGKRVGGPLGERRR
jgi:hypothetical protein